jgi:transcriptional regulator with PAS, ATPase and Fis domain
VYGGLEEMNQVSDNMIGVSKEMRKVKSLTEMVAPSRTSVLILGETGTGKELVARAIHAQSPRREAPFVVINSGALQENILESELFGYKRGAFTGAQSHKQGLLEVANNGTCFIDEVGDMGPSIQTKVLRVVESGVFMKLGDTRETKVDVRFKDLSSLVEDSSFRKDLFYRINSFIIKLPPLRERGEDIVLLANYFLNRFSRGDKYLSSEVLRLFATYDWPGNIRELANVVQSSVLVSGSRRNIVVDDLPENIINPVAPKANHGARAYAEVTSLHMRQAQHVVKVMDIAEGNKAEAARLLGISRNKLYRMLELRGS